MNKPKLQSHIQYKYSLNRGKLMGTLEVLDDGGVVDVDYWLVEGDTHPTGLTLFLVPKYPIGEDNDLVITVSGKNSDGNSDSDEITIPAFTQENAAFLVTNSGNAETWTEVDGITLDVTGYGNTNDQVDLIAIPNPLVSASWTNLMFQTSSDLTPGGTMMPVPDRMDPVAEIIRMRGDNTFSVAGVYVANDDVNTISKLRGRIATFLMEYHEDGGPVVTEYHILFDAAFNEMPISAPDNGLVTLTGSGFFKKLMIYSP